MTPIHFKPNEPQVLALKESSGVFEGFNVLYETTDGKLLSLPRPAAVKLGMLDPAPSEEISVTKCQESPKSPCEWVFALTARSEQLRAQAEADAEELARRTKRDLEGQLSESLKNREIPRKVPGKASEPVRQMPNPQRSSQQDAPEIQKGTGTYGPVPQVAYAARKGKPEAVPFNVAFVEVTRFVVEGLKEVGEQWNDQAKQDAICSVLISASRQGLLTLWERGEAA
jgi:hypothetical protein